MIVVSRNLNRRRRRPEISIAPLIDLIFILLIFFLVTTSFTKETGIEINRPRAVTSKSLNASSLMVFITEPGEIYFEDRRIDIFSLRAIVKRRLIFKPDMQVIIIADRASSTGRVIEVLDECKLAGAGNVSVAARTE